MMSLYVNRRGTDREKGNVEKMPKGLKGLHARLLALARQRG